MVARAGGLNQWTRLRLRRRGSAFLDRAGVPPERRHFEYVYQGRYEYQSWEIEVPFDLSDPTINEQDVERLLAAFHATHERIYTIKLSQPTSL